ncbi:MAG: hypothetical protein ACRDRN_16840 [Sciscionella sp.]
MTGSVTRPTGLDDSGQRLWAELTADGAPAPLTSVLLLQTCRIVDRLDRLDRQLRGEDWLRFYSRDDGGTEVTVYVDKVLAEEREQAVALKGLITELRQLMGKAKPQEQKGGGVLADLAARRAARSASTAG